jgi:hypothetical protein
LDKLEAEGHVLPGSDREKKLVFEMDAERVHTIARDRGRSGDAAKYGFVSALGDRRHYSAANQRAWDRKRWGRPASVSTWAKHGSRDFSVKV